nr:MAG TPA: hypothetical protein [Caudoviricetes sp.]
MNQPSWRVSLQLPDLWGRSIFFEKKLKNFIKTLDFLGIP